MQGAGGQLAVVGGGAVRMEVAAREAMPVVDAITPACITMSAALDGDAAGSGPGALLVLRGTRVSPPSAVALCRQNGRYLAVEEHGSGGADGRSPAQEWARIWPVGLAPGCAELEVQAGNLLSAPRPLLVLPDAAAAAEVNALAAAAPVTPAATAAMDAFLREVGLVVSWTHRDVAAAAAAASGCPARPYPPALLRRVASTARQLAVVAAARGCAALTALLLEGACADGSSAAEAAAAMDAACPPSLLHIVAGSGCPQLVGVLREWGLRRGLRWEVRAAAPTAGGAPPLSPLHVAAVLPDGGAMHVALATLDPSAVARLWTQHGPGGLPSPEELVLLAAARAYRPVWRTPVVALRAATAPPALVAAQAYAAAAKCGTAPEPDFGNGKAATAPGACCCVCCGKARQRSPRPALLVGKLRAAAKQEASDQALHQHLDGELRLESCPPCFQWCTLDAVTAPRPAPSRPHP